MTFRTSFALVALASALAATPPAVASEVVIMRSGKRLEVERAYARPGGWHLQLIGGGSVILPDSVVKRVSSAAADMPEARGPLVASTGGWTPSAASSSSSPDGVPPEFVRDAEVRLSKAEELRAPGFSGGRDLASFPRGLPANQVAGPGLGQNAPRSLAGQANAPKPSSPLGSRSLRRQTGGPVGQAPLAPGMDPALAGGGLPSLRDP